MRTLSWRLVASTTTAIIVFLTTGSITATSSIVVMEFVFKWSLQMAHDYAWSKYS